MYVQMPLKGKHETQFWVHAFHLDDWVEKLRVMMNEKTERTTAFNPVCQEYTAGSMRFCCVLGLSVDKLGLFDGLGWVWITTGDEHWQKALKDSQKLFNDILRVNETERGRPWDEVVEIEPGKEI